MKLKQKIRVIERFLDNISNPIYLFYLIYSIILAFWIYPYYGKGLIIETFLGIMLFIISILFFRKTISFLFRPSKRQEIIIQSFNGKPEEAIDYLMSEAENWLNNVLNFIDNVKYNTTNIDESQDWTTNVLKFETAKDNKNTVKYNKKLEKKILPSDFEDIFNGICETINVDYEAIEKLIGVRGSTDLKTVEEIINDYNFIKNDINKLKNVKDINDRAINKKLYSIYVRKNRLERSLEHLKNLKHRDYFIPDLLSIIRDASTGRAVVKSAEVLQKADNIEDLMWLIKFVNSRTGFNMAELLGLTVEHEEVKWYEKKVVKISDHKDYMKIFELNSGTAEVLYDECKNITEIKKAYSETHEIYNTENMEDFSKIIDFLVEFKTKRDDALNNIWKNFSEWHWKELKNYFKPETTQPLGIALLSGYSNTLEFILDEILKKAKSDPDLDVKIIQILLIKSEQKYGDEEFLRAELIGKYPDLKCNVIPLTSIKERGIKIGKVFVGIESIDILGDIVHPRGSVKGINEIKEFADQAYLYAFGETYKVKNFKKIFIDYTSLTFCPYNEINFLITDHGIHKLNEESKWEFLENETWIQTDMGTLECCLNYWQDFIN